MRENIGEKIGEDPNPLFCHPIVLDASYEMIKRPPYAI
jgi:hypothetical protein